MDKTVSKGSHLLEGRAIPFTSGLAFCFVLKCGRLKCHVNARGVHVVYESFRYIPTTFYSYLQRIIGV